MALCCGHIRAPFLTLAWPSAEMGPMGIEGSVALGFREVKDAEAQSVLVSQLQEQGKATAVARYFDVDDVIDPVTSRDRIIQALYLNSRL
jgi:acetyl-CoA carboxylase carboxyltransferase component